MYIILICSFISFMKHISCYSDSESAESNRIEVTPFYDTIIYSDIADIINELDNKGISPLNVFTSSDSQSDEKIEDLLTEYQHYVEKAHKQRKNFIEKTKSKNKVPQLRHDQFSKPKKGQEHKKNDYFYSNAFSSGAFKFPETSFGNPLDVFIPLNSKGNYLNKGDISTVSPKIAHGNPFPFETVIFKDEKLLDLPPVMLKPPFDPVHSSCYCKNGHFPCECNCKQCIIPLDRILGEPPLKIHPQEEQPILHSSLDNENIKEMNENTLNIHIKVDLQLPKLQENLGKYRNHNRDKASETEDLLSKELTTAIKLPFAPMELFSYKRPFKYTKDESAPVHKLVVHKKKKSRGNNNNKKHRKKFITFHNIKLEQESLFPLRFVDNVNGTYKANNKTNNVNGTTTEFSNVLQWIDNDSLINKTNDILNNTHKLTNLYRTPKIYNITSNSTTEESSKSENSIDTEFTKPNVTANQPIIREKREVIKKLNKTLLTDDELLYWPSVSGNETFLVKKDITSIILENENKKTKINMSKETIRQNHTKLLEQAIFGDVDWDDVDTLAPAFMSFVGKYVRGILTFCSQQVCHSMKCGDKTCLHRVCAPAVRLNNKGHCAGSKVTDSVASMESIMDLPSNIVFEVVDILQNKLLGKIFGKATFCINFKCITIMASKKTFTKSRCAAKELTAAGHCSNVKTVKIM